MLYANPVIINELDFYIYILFFLFLKIIHFAKQMHSISRVSYCIKKSHLIKLI